MNIISNIMSFCFKLIFGLFTRTQAPIKRKPIVYKREEECRTILEELFPKHKFNKIRPQFLNNPKTKRNLEIDCYCEKLKLAIEYNGKQHYDFVPRFHSSKDDLVQQKLRDKLKQKLCSQNNITLVTVPYHIKDIRSYLILELRKKGFKVY